MLLKEDDERQGRPPSWLDGRPALTRLITATDVDDAALEDSAEATGDDSAPADSAAPSDATPADDQQVNNEAPATRLVNVERPSRRRYATIFCSEIPSFPFRIHYKVLHHVVWMEEANVTRLGIAVSLKKRIHNVSSGCKS